MLPGDGLAGASFGVEWFSGDMLRKSGKVGGGGSFRGDMEENRVGVEVREEGR